MTVYLDFKVVPETNAFVHPHKSLSLSHKNHLAWYNQVMVVINAEIYLRFKE